MAVHHPEDILILTKTYPSPSSKYRETSCVAGINRDGELRRLYPVPYRYMDGERRFKKWEWIRADVVSALKDKRPESHNIDINSIIILHEKVGTENHWAKRLKWIEPHVLKNFDDLEKSRLTTGQTLGFIRPTKLISLEITPVKDVEWTQEEKLKLTQDGLFDSEEVKRRIPLIKLPYDFHYNYECRENGETVIEKHKISDWEAGALYFTCKHRYGSGWEAKFRDLLEIDFREKDMTFLMGTIHRFPGQWLIVGLIYPPKPPQKRAEQIEMALEP